MGKKYYAADSAVITGNVKLSENVSVWHGAVVRGDLDKISIGKNTNIQDGCILHVNRGEPVSVGENVTVGHGAILHGCTVGDNSLIGMGSIVLDGTVIGDHCIIGAGSLVPGHKTFPSGTLALGNPAKVVRPLTEKELNHFAESAASYTACAEEQLTAYDLPGEAEE